MPVQKGACILESIPPLLPNGSIENHNIPQARPSDCNLFSRQIHKRSAELRLLWLGGGHPLSPRIVNKQTSPNDTALGFCVSTMMWSRAASPAIRKLATRVIVFVPPDQADEGYEPYTALCRGENASSSDLSECYRASNVLNPLYRGLYADQLERWFRVFDRSQVTKSSMVVVHENKPRDKREGMPVPFLMET